MHEFEPRFEEYLNQIVLSVKIDRQEKKQLKREWNQHLFDSLNNLIQRGFSQDEAIEMAIQQFGTPELLKQEIAQIYLLSRKQQRLKELSIWIICLIAASIGPYLLIEAYYSIGFTLTSALALVLYYFVYHKIIKNIPNLMAYIAILPIYAFWVYAFLKLGNEVSLGQYIHNLFSLDWSRLTGVDGLFQFPTLHMLWYIIVLINILSPCNKSIIKSITISSFRYWSTLAVGLALAKISPSSETTVLVMNVALLYAFLQQIVSKIKFTRSPTIAIF